MMKPPKNILAILFLTLTTFGCSDARISARAFALKPQSPQKFTRYRIAQNPAITHRFLDQYFRSDIKAYVARNQDRIDETTQTMLGPSELPPIQKQCTDAAMALLSAKGLTHDQRAPQIIVYLEFSQGSFAYTIPSRSSFSETSELTGTNNRRTMTKHEYIGARTNISYGVSLCAVIVDAKTHAVIWQSSVTGITEDNHQKALRTYLIRYLFSTYPLSMAEHVRSVDVNALD